MFAAVDLGASSGRVVAGHVAADALELVEVHRFGNGPVHLVDGLHWDIVDLYQETLDGLGRLRHEVGAPDGVAIDSWAVDYGLIGSGGTLLGTPFHYRDPRNAAVVARVHERIPFDELYRRNGLQHLPFTTLYQLAAEHDGPLLALAERVLLVPDLLGFWLTGRQVSELTNASTTGLLDVHTRRWSPELLDAAGVRPELLADVVPTGTSLGSLRRHVAEETGLDASTPLTTVGSHDTASAVLGVPAADERFAYVSCGTWGLVGVELVNPQVDAAAREANFTNETGVDGTVRFLRNVMGLWLLQESLTAWRRTGYDADLAGLLDEAAALPSGGPTVDADDGRFAAPGDMPSRIADACRETDQPVPDTPARLVRCVVDSLVAAFARALQEATTVSGQQVDVVHVVGGGARNALLCQLLADACGRPVLAGPVEATALGNVLVQARTAGVLRGDRFVLRDLIRRTHTVRRYQPR